MDAGGGREQGSQRYSCDIFFPWTLSSSESFGVSRKFQSGKNAKKAAELFLEAKRQRQLAQGLTDKEEPLEQQIDRGPSLMEVHQERLEKGLVEQRRTEREPPGKRRPFDREQVCLGLISSLRYDLRGFQDVLTRAKMNSRQVDDLVQHARELNSRFDRGSFQR